MPGMSARIKAKKGRFGVDGLVPTIQILAPEDGFTIAKAGSPVATADFTLRGQAFDDLQGDVSSTIDWSTDQAEGALGTGKSLAVQLTTEATHVITASVTVGGDTVTDTIKVVVTA